MAEQMRATVGILSVGEMGMGIAQLLIAHGFSVLTNCSGRSQETVDRAEAAHVGLVDSDEALVRRCDVILSVVPPRDALATAQRIVDALPGADARPTSDARPLYFADMNAVAPATVAAMAALVQSAAAPVRFVDGCVLGGPPRETDTGVWYRPLMPTSGPHTLDAFPGLAAALNSRHLAAELGRASGLKMCFAAMTKGYAAIAIEAFAAAHALGVRADLQWAMAALLPDRVAPTEAALTGMPPKAYRWVREMEEISTTFADAAGFAPDLFQGAADVFRVVAHDTVLGQEKTGARKRGRTAEDVAAAVAQGLAAKRSRLAPADVDTSKETA